MGSYIVVTARITILTSTESSACEYTVVINHRHRRYGFIINNCIHLFKADGNSLNQSICYIKLNFNVD